MRRQRSGSLLRRVACVMAAPGVVVVCGCAVPSHREVQRREPAGLTAHSGSFRRIQPLWCAGEGAGAVTVVFCRSRLLLENNRVTFSCHCSLFHSPFFFANFSCFSDNSSPSLVLRGILLVLGSADNIGVFGSNDLPIFIDPELLS